MQNYFKSILKSCDIRNVNFHFVNHLCFIMPTPSIIVNIQHIRKIDGKNKKLILENDDETLISRRKYKEVFDALNRYMTNGEL